MGRRRGVSVGASQGSKSEEMSGIFLERSRGKVDWIYDVKILRVDLVFGYFGYFFDLA